MKRELHDSFLRAAALLTVLPAALLPLRNPDLFWHLHAGTWIAAHRALPRVDSFSFTAAGKPWVDFEWLSQLLFVLARALGGPTGLWGLKALLVVAIAAALNRALRRAGSGATARALLLSLWACGALLYADLRPDLFSVLGLALLLGEPERPAAAGSAGAYFAAFALWASLHAGFAFGLLALAVRALVLAARGRRETVRSAAALAICSAAGTLATPYGTGPYRVLLAHGAAAAELSRYILEWRPIALRHPLEALFWLKLLIVVVSVASAARAAPRRQADFPWELAVVALALAAAAQRHGRLVSYFDAAFVVCAAALWRWARPRPRMLWRAAPCAWLALDAAFLVWFCRGLAWTAPVDDALVIPSAARFLDAQQPVFAPLRVYNRWEWGGYLGWRLRPWYRVYDDGRYLFHEYLVAAENAEATPELWQTFLDDERLDGAVVRSLDAWRPSTKIYPDGSRRVFARPWYSDYMPRQRWALVYWDDRALIFVRRNAVPAGWLAAHEYRWLKPKDEAAFREGLRLGEIPAGPLATEAARHRRETGPSAPVWRGPDELDRRDVGRPR